MLDTIKGKYETQSKAINKSIWSDELLTSYYHSYFNNLTSKQLDREFNNDISLLVKVLSKLSEEDRTRLIDTLSYLIEFYVENKVEKEMNLSFQQLLKL